MDASEVRLEDKSYLKTEIKQEYDVLQGISPETVPIKDKPWSIDLNKIKSEPDILDVENEANYYVTERELRSITGMKTEGFQIKSDDENGTSWEFGNYVGNEEDVRERVKHIGEDNAIDSLYSLKCEDIEMKSEENYSDTTSQNLKDEPVDYTSECRSEYVEKLYNYALDSQMNPYESKDIYCGSSEEQEYRCDSCEYKTDRKRNLTRHQLRHKDIPEDKIYKCESCTYKTIYRGHFREHQLRHVDIPEEKMYKCDSCEYKTGFKGTFIQHQQTHKTTSDKTYKCDSCDFKTIYKNSFKQHQFRHKNIPEEQMFKCDSCSYKTHQKKNLTNHQLRHKNIPEDKIFKCDSCSYRTVYKAHFIEHQIRHKDIPEEQMFKCDMCDYKTGFKGNFTRHQLKHKDISEKPVYKCDQCDYITFHRHYLTRHQVRHKPKKQNPS